MNFRVVQQASPFWSFWMDIGSFRHGLLLGARGRSTESMHSKRVPSTAERLGCCVATRKSSM
jgi:hypothetical protein